MNFMTTRYDSMLELSRNLKELFELCGTNPSFKHIKQSPKIISLMEKLFRDGSVIEYLNNANSLTLSALSALKEKQLEFWCSNENNKRLEVLEEENKSLRMQIQNQEKEYQDRLSVLENTTSQIPVKSENPDMIQEDSLSIIKNIITMNDTLQARLEWATDNFPESDNAIKIIKTQLKETAKLLRNAGVNILDGCGTFDSSTCTVIETIVTDDDTLVDTIAKIFRPGYEYMGEMLRSKEVILYVKG